MSIPIPQPVAFFGLRTGVKGNAHFITDHDILYPAGSVLVIHNYIQKRQKFIKLVDQQRNLKEIVLSPNRKVAAVTDHGEKPTITIYDMTTTKRKKVLVLPGDIEAQEFITFQFTHDSKYLLAVTDEPDSSLYAFNWEKGKIESSCKATTVGNVGTVAQLATHPSDNTTCVLVGPGLFRLMMVTETVWRQFGWQKADQLPLCCVVYLTPERILAATKDGRLILVENNELKGIFKAGDIKELDPKTCDVQQSSSVLSITDSKNSIDMEIRSLISFYKGFAFSLGTGSIYYFEVDTHQVYKKRNVFVISNSEFEEVMDMDLNTVRHLCINITQDHLIATTDRCQLYEVRLGTSDRNQPITPVSMNLLGQQLHHGPVSGLAICAWKPIFMTVGQIDRTVRLWNYETESQDLIKHYPEDVFCIALHPTGLYAVLGFCDKLRYMTVLIDNLQLLREFPIRSCNTCSFSNNGHMFAAANGHIIQIFSTITFENMYTLKGHFGKIARMVWTPQDLKLVTCGLEGAIYEWDLATGHRVGEVITKSCTYNDVVITTDGRTIYSVGSDGNIKEITGSQIIRSVRLGDGSKLDAVVLSRSNLMLFSSGMQGIVFSIKYPLSDPAHYNEYHMHNGDVTYMRLTYDDNVLLSVAEDGSVCIWKLAMTEGKTVQMDRDFAHSKEILISRNELQDKLTLIRNLNSRLNELANEHDYNTKKMLNQHEQILKDLNNSYSAIVEELKAKNENLEADHSLEVNKIQTEIAEMKLAHDQAIQSLEANYYGKLIVEYDKYTQLDLRCTKMREDYERRLDAAEKKLIKSLEDQSETYENQLLVKSVEFEQLRSQLDQERSEHENIKQQIEDDADREILSLRTTFEKQFREERDMNVRLRGEAGVTKKKLLGSQKESDELRHQISELQGEHQQFQQAVHALDRDVIDLKKEVSERDLTIQQKEKNIFDLKRHNQELDKFKFVLNYKIKELKNQIEPKDLEIKEKKEQIGDMEQELEKLQRNVASIELQLTEQREKLTATEIEYQSEKNRHITTTRLLRRLWADLHNTSSLIQDPKQLRETLKELYQKYNSSPSLLLSRAQDTDAQAEFLRQRKHLERTVASLKKQVYKGGLSHQGDYARILNENIYLIKEMNELRKQLKKAHSEVRNLELVAGVPKKRNLNTREVKIESHHSIPIEQKQVKELEKAVKELQKEVDELVARLSPEDKAAYWEEKRIRESRFPKFDVEDEDT